MPLTRLITIRKTGPTTLKYTSGGVNADQLIVNPDDKVAWTSPDGHIVILFKGNLSPFSTTKHVLCADLGQQTTPARKIRKLISQEQPQKPFTYAVAHLAPNDVLLIDDPDLIIDDPGGGGGAPAPLPKKKPAIKIVRTPAK